MIQAKAVENLYRALIERLEVSLEVIIKINIIVIYSCPPPPSLLLSLTQPLSRQLAHSTDEVQRLGAEVGKLRDQVAKMTEEQVLLLDVEDNASLLDDHSPLLQSRDQPPEDILLIDFNGASKDEMNLPPSVDKPQPLSEDLLGPAMDTSDLPQLGGPILQPEVLSDKDTLSQELF